MGLAPVLVSVRAVVVVLCALAAAVTTSTAPAAAETGMSNGQEYTLEAATIDGADADNTGRWDVRIVALTGGDHAVSEVFNQACRGAADEQIDRAKAEVNPGENWSFEGNGEVRFSSIAVAQLILGTHYYGAHPRSYISTVVVDTRNAEPLRVVQLFNDPQAGLERLSQLTGAEPRADNFMNWIPTPNGLEIHFAPYQFGIALPETKLVSWAALADLIAPGMNGIMNS